MVQRQVPFEKLSLAFETVRGTPITPPTWTTKLAGTLTPQPKPFMPAAPNSLAEYQAEQIVHTLGVWDASAEAMDVNDMLYLLNMCVAPNSTPTTPGTLSKLWTFNRVVTSDTVKSATLYWGDANAPLFQSAYAMCEKLSWDADSTGEKGVSVKASGSAQYPTKLGANPSIPALTIAPYLVPANMQVFLDTSSAIGTTEITSTGGCRLLKASGSVESGIIYEYPAVGPAGGTSFSSTSRKVSHPETKLTMLIPDETQLVQALASTDVKLRVRINGPKIETVVTDFYYYFQWDVYGLLMLDSWGDLDGGSRTMELSVIGHYDTTLASDFSAAVQTTKATL